MSDSIAYSILIVSFVLIILPVIVSFIDDNRYRSYSETLKLGIISILLVLLCSGILGFIIWAINHLTK